VIEMFDLAGENEALRFSPYCWRIRMALAHKGLEARFIPWRFTEKEALAFSGQGAVPVLRDGDTVVFDSNRIAAYLDQHYAHMPLLFEGPQSRALCELIHHQVQMNVQMALLKIIMMDLFAVLDPRDRDYFRSTREARLGKRLEDVVGDGAEGRALLNSALAPFRQTLRVQAFLAGDQPAYADYILFGAFMWAKIVSPQTLIGADDAVYQWRERMLDLFDGMARCAPAQG
jgi:glutathione S-transferase